MNAFSHNPYLTKTNKIQEEDQMTQLMKDLCNRQMQDYITRFNPTFRYDEGNKWACDRLHSPSCSPIQSSGYYSELSSNDSLCRDVIHSDSDGSLCASDSATEAESIPDSVFEAAPCDNSDKELFDGNSPRIITINIELKPQDILQYLTDATQKIELRLSSPAVCPTALKGPSDEELAALPIPEFLPNGKVRFVDRTEKEGSSGEQMKKEDHEQKSELLFSRPQRPCRFFMAGCKKGDRCKFFHPYKYNYNNRHINDYNNTSRGGYHRPPQGEDRDVYF